MTFIIVAGPHGSCADVYARFLSQKLSEEKCALLTAHTNMTSAFSAITQYFQSRKYIIFTSKTLVTAASVDTCVKSIKEKYPTSNIYIVAGNPYIYNVCCDNLDILQERQWITNAPALKEANRELNYGGLNVIAYYPILKLRECNETSYY